MLWNLNKWLFFGIQSTEYKRFKCQILTIWVGSLKNSMNKRFPRCLIKIWFYTYWKNWLCMGTQDAKPIFLKSLWLVFARAIKQDRNLFAAKGYSFISKFGQQFWFISNHELVSYGMSGYSSTMLGKTIFLVREPQILKNRRCGGNNILLSSEKLARCPLNIRLAAV